jgi:Uma2 family endonuclease
MSATLTPASPPPAQLTAEEFVKLHGHESSVELVKGRVVRYPTPGVKHGEVCLAAGAIIRDFVKQHNLGRVVSNDTFIRTATGPDSYRGADICYISYTALPKKEASPDGPLELPPELVIEVRSPTDRLNQLTAKATEYLDAGVKAVAILDPKTESAAIFQLDELPQRFSNGDEIAFPDILPGFAVPVRKFFE